MLLSLLPAACVCEMHLKIVHCASPNFPETKNLVNVIVQIELYSETQYLYASVSNV
jgi:hypothetical protein